MLTVNLQ